MWAPQRDAGIEHLALRQTDTEVKVDSLVIGIAHNSPFRFQYEIKIDQNWSVKECSFHLDGGEREIRLTADNNHCWTDASGTHIAELDGCVDIDISVTPFTNTLPIRRVFLEPGQSVDIAVVYIAVPELTVSSFPQRYTCLAKNPEGGAYRYESLASGYTADLNVDAQGLVIDYPGNWKRVWNCMS